MTDLSQPLEPAPRRGLGPLDLLSVVIVAALAGGAAYFALTAPDGRYPAHIGLSGAVDRWADKAEFVRELWLLTGITALLGGFMAWAPRSRTLGPQVERAGAVFAVARALGVCGPAFGGGLIMAIGLGLIRPGEDQTLVIRVIMAFLAITFLALGEALGRAKPNALAGIRSYFTLTSRLAWDKANRLGGRLFFWIGLVGLLATPFAPQPHGMIALVAAVILTAVLCYVEAWRVWKSDPERREPA